MIIPKVTQLANNQFLIKFGDKTIFQSHDSIICVIYSDGVVILGPNWKISKTTSKYRNRVLKEDTKTTERKLWSGEYSINYSL